MEIVFKIFRMIALVFSCYGWIYWIIEKRKIKQEFSILILTSGIGSLMFFAGILNILELASIGIFLTGMVWAFVSVREKKNPCEFITVGIAIFIIAAIFILFLLYGTKVLRYDNFSHWAVVARTIVKENRFPNFQDSIIMFQSYPLGSAAYIYYICKITGIHSEWMMLYAQAIVILGALIPLFAFTKNKLTNNILVTITIIFILCSNIRLTDLCVDTLLTVVGAGGVLFCAYYNHKISKMYKYIIPILIFLVSIKNSGIFFVFAILAYMLVLCKWNGKKWKIILGLLSVPLSTILLWSQHVKLVFTSGMSAKHSMSVENLTSIFQGKTQEDIVNIVKAYCEKIFSVNNPVIYIFMIFVILFVFYKLAKKQSIIKRSILFMVLAYVGYQISLLGMYVFSMPTDEALNMASYERYHITMIGFLFIVILPYIMVALGMQKRKILVTSIIILLAYVILLPQFEYLKRIRYETTERYRYEKIIQDNQVPYDSSYIFLQEDDDYGYSYYFYRYYFGTVNVAVYNKNQLEDIGEQWRNYEYLIVLDETKENTEYLENILHTTPKERVIKLGEYK